MAVMRLLTIISIILTTFVLQAQQVADSLFNPVIISPQYSLGKGSVIFLDEGHHNFHTTTGRFKPFVDFLQRDGYVLKGISDSFTSDNLKAARILVIANALNEKTQSEWTLPTPSAFTDFEITTLKTWVKQGGSLFLIADHMPFAGASEKLAAAFGFKFYNGFAMNKNPLPGTTDIFTLENGLSENVITRGRNQNDKITTVQSFTGQAFEIPSSAFPLIILDDRFDLLLPQTAWNFTENSTSIPARNLAQGAYMSYGKGRLVVFGEAAMFSAQIQRDSIRMGMNAKTAFQNPQFLLHVIHWLDHPLD